MEFKPFQKNHLEQVLDIANITLGENYLTRVSLNQFLNSKSHFAFVSIEDKKVLGFVSSIILTPIQLKNIVLKENDWFYELAKNHSKIAFRKHTIVNPIFLNIGVGTKLVKFSNNIIDSLCDLQISTVWKKNDENIMSKLLLKNEFKFIKSIPNYWEKNSLNNNYSCPICGIPPCICAASVVIKHKKTD
jgi:hypothetical protein